MIQTLLHFTLLISATLLRSQVSFGTRQGLQAACNSVDVKIIQLLGLSVAFWAVVFDGQHFLFL